MFTKTIFLTAFLFSLDALAVTRANPNGQFGWTVEEVSVPGTSATRCHSEDWAGDFLMQIEERLQDSDNFDQYHAQRAMESIRLGMQNEPEFCQPPMTTDMGTKLFMLAMAEAFFVKEATCNPEVSNPHAPHGTAVGLGQMSVDNANQHQCRTHDGQTITNNEQLKDPRTNARCVAQIMMNCAAGLPNADGQGGSVDNQSNREAIMSVTASFCEVASGGTSSLLQNGFVSMDSICHAANGAPCEDRRQNPFFQRNPAASRTTL